MAERAEEGGVTARAEGEAAPGAPEASAEAGAAAEAVTGEGAGGPEGALGGAAEGAAEGAGSAGMPEAFDEDTMTPPAGAAGEAGAGSGDERSGSRGRDEDASEEGDARDDEGADAEAEAEEEEASEDGSRAGEASGTEAGGSGGESDRAAGGEAPGGGGTNEEEEDGAGEEEEEEGEEEEGGAGTGSEGARLSGGEAAEEEGGGETTGGPGDLENELEVEQGIHITAKERAALSKKLQVLGLGGVWEGNTNYEPLQRVDPEQTVPSISRKKAIHIKEDVVAIYHGTGGRKAPNLSAPSKNAPSGGKLAFGMQSLKDPLAASEGPVDYKALYKQVHQQLSAVSRQAGSEIQARDKEIKRLRKLCVVQQEQISKESSHITALSQALEEVKREGIAELNEARKTFSQLERRSIQVQRQAGAATAEQERALEEASAQIVSLRAERDRLAEALGVISAVTVGGRAALRGEMPDPHTIKQEAEAAKAEGAEPLPRNPGAWLKFSYATAAGKSKDVPTPAVPARKRGAVGSRRPPARTAPYGGDGERALTALVAAVSRLHMKREVTQKQCSAASMRSEKLSAALDKMHREFQAVEVVVEAVERETGEIKRARKLAGVAPSGVSSGLSGRLTAASSILRRVNVEFDAFQEENKRLRAQVLELDFYSKLHDKVIEVGRDVQVLGQRSALQQPL